MSIIKEAEELFGEMRDATTEEQGCINNYIKDISELTGINIYDLIDDKEKLYEQSRKLKSRTIGGFWENGNLDRRTSSYVL